MAATGPVLVPHPSTIRGPIEEYYNDIRDDLWVTYRAAVASAETTLRAALVANEATKADALEAAGLNRDGSTPSNYPASAAPADTALPTISGTAQVGEELSVSAGTWARLPTNVTPTYQWERIDADDTHHLDITGANEDTYTLVEADEGHKIRCTVTATTAEGTHSASSTYTTAVLPHAPENTAVPTITGTASVGQVLTLHEGTWSGDPTFTYQWERADSDGSNAADIEGEQDTTYTIVGGDSGKKIRIIVTGTNAGGEDTAVSEWTAVIVG